MKIKTYLDERMETQRDFARRIGVSEVTLSRIINGRQIASASTVRKIRIATVGSVTAEDLEPIERAARNNETMRREIWPKH